ncbi:MAG: LysM peptidoglycan-binding domain-containing protein [Pseudomonadota bacterium]
MSSSLKGVWVFCGVGAAVFVAASGQLIDFNAMIPRPNNDQPAGLLQSADDAVEIAPSDQPVETAALSSEASVEDANEPTAVSQAATEPAPDWELTGPTFDILRVEPDGSTLIAGRAIPDSEVEIMSGDDVVATTTANAAGEFVALLDDALAIGDYAMTIRSTPPEGEVVISQQTAIVSIPEDRAQGILAMVEMPGEASRLISTPQIVVDEQEPVEIVQEAEAVAEVATPATVEPELPELLTLAPEAPAIESSEPILAEGRVMPASPGQVGAPPLSSPVPELLELGAGTPLFAPAEEPETQAPVEVAEVQPEPETEADVLEPADLKVAVEAVEIDGSEVFVAGAATPGAQLRVYANEVLLGDVVASEGGRFLVQVEKDLPIGEYTFRVDMLNPQTAEVVRRAAVPFSRTDDTQLAAVAVEPAVQLPQTAPTIATDTENVSIDPQQVATLEGEPEVPTETATLQPTNQSVIIRRGDTLWQISRRVYGKGVKYTTIYLANQDQIQNPGRIWPGQVFDVPDQAQDDAVALEKHQELRLQR